MKRALAVAVLALAGCSSSAAHSSPTTSVKGSLSTSTTAPSDDDALKRAVYAYSQDFGVGDGGAAWGTVSDRCKQQVAEVDFRAAVAAAGVKDAGLHVTKYKAQIDGTAATVDYTTSHADIGTYKGQRWVRDGGAWHWDGC